MYREIWQLIKSPVPKICNVEISPAFFLIGLHEPELIFPKNPLNQPPMQRPTANARNVGSDYHTSYSLNSLKGGYIGDYIGTTIRDIKGDTRSLDYSSYGLGSCFLMAIARAWSSRGFRV